LEQALTAEVQSEFHHMGEEGIFLAVSCKTRLQGIKKEAA